jgi:hypothetical protein
MANVDLLHGNAVVGMLTCTLLLVIASMPSKKTITSISCSSRSSIDMFHSGEPGLQR